MSKAVPLDHEFNKGKFAELLIRAQGKRTQAQFAQDCGLSAAHLNRFYNLRKESPPVPSTITKIAQNAEGGVTCEDLLEAAGYNPQKNYTRNREPQHGTQMPRLLCVAGLVKYLSHSTFKWNAHYFAREIKRENDYFDLEIDVLDSDVLEHWFFASQFLRGDVNDKTFLSNFYGSLCYQGLPPKTKVSLVMWSAKIFDIIKTNPPVMLPIYFSLILFDPDYTEIIKEEYLPTALDLPDDLKTVFILERKD